MPDGFPSGFAVGLAAEEAAETGHAAVSSDEGKTWRHVRNIETRSDQTYAYVSLAFVGPRAVMSYYVRDDKTGRISTRFRSVPVQWFYK